ncbi:MAG: recombination mediator RecR [bacterium]
MDYFYPEISRLIEVLQKLPLVGPKTSEKVAFFIIDSPNELVEEIIESIKNVKENIVKCSRCFSLTAIPNNPCSICIDQNREPILCVVENFYDQMIIERYGIFSGKYHVLEGLIDPIEGKTPDKIRIKELLRRISSESIKELIFAIPSSIEGDMTVEYITSKVKEINDSITISRLAVGIPAGSTIENIDKVTLINAIHNRKPV